MTSGEAMQGLTSKDASIEETLIEVAAPSRSCRPKEKHSAIKGFALRLKLSFGTAPPIYKLRINPARCFAHHFLGKF